jgi:predicted ferric reductase
MPEIKTYPTGSKTHANQPTAPGKTTTSDDKATTFGWLGGGLAFLGLLVVGVFAAQLPAAASSGDALRQVFATDSTQTMWYITRAAGLTSYLLLWLSVAWGMAVSSKILDALLHRSFSYDFHEFLSLAAIGFIALHMGVLLFDGYMPYSLTQLLVPFLSPYRPLWVGIGAISLYLTLLVTVTFYLRGRIGMKAFRAIHVLSLAAYLGVTLHGLLAGTDSSLPMVLALYAGTFLVVIFLTAYWIFLVIQKGRAKKHLPAPAAASLPGRQASTRF